MTPDEWQRVREVLASALDLPAARRSAFLDQACGGDAALRREVESLIAADASAAAFLPTGGVSEPPAALPPLAPGTALGPYVIGELLGAGGMGEVYRARDDRLAREVAVKVLPPSSAGDPERQRRFDEEARAAGTLNHPNVLAVYDVGHHGSVRYVVSELLEGETLRARLRRGPVPLAEALDLARQMAAGLAAAHGKGIVHRDLKPENLFLTREGRLKILDFGLAKRTLEPQALSGADTRSAHTRPGVMLGTAAYMSPEQARGEAADPRSDVFAFGAVLYEMLAGRPAFAHDSIAETLSAVLRDDPPPLAVPAEVDALLRRCLSRRAPDRYAGAEELVDALASPMAAPPARPRAVAVLPFRDLAGSESGHFGLGLADATITELARLKSLVVRPTSAVLPYTGGAADLRAAGRELDVDAVVEASFQRAGDRLRVTVQVVDVREARPLWAGKIETSPADVFAVQDEVASAIARALEVELQPSPRGAAAGPRADVYELYMRGKLHLYRETLPDFVAAIDWFEKARAADAGFALAYAGLATAYVRMADEYQPEGDWYVRAQALCARALELQPGLPEARYTRALMLWSPPGGFEHAAAMRELLAALRAQPGLEEAHVRLSTILWHVGLLEPARRHITRALEINPAHLWARQHLASCEYQAGRYADCRELAAELRDPMPSYWVYYLHVHSLLRLGQTAAALASLDRMTHEVAPGTTHSIRALMAALDGDAATSLREAEQAERSRKQYIHYHHAQYDMACAQAVLGRGQEAVAWLARAARNGYPCASLFQADPLLVSLRGLPEFERLLAELRAECAGYERIYAELAPTSATPGRIAPAGPEGPPPARP
jgi:serine/threonine-protein kinase